MFTFKVEQFHFVTELVLSVKHQTTYCVLLHAKKLELRNVFCSAG